MVLRLIYLGLPNIQINSFIYYTWSSKWVMTLIAHSRVQERTTENSVHLYIFQTGRVAHTQASCLTPEEETTTISQKRTNYVFKHGLWHLYDVCAKCESGNLRCVTLPPIQLSGCCSWRRIAADLDWHGPSLESPSTSPSRNPQGY